MKKPELTENGKAVLITAPVSLFVFEILTRGGTIGLALAGAATFVAARHGSDIKNAGSRLLQGLIVTEKRQPTEQEIEAYIQENSPASEQVNQPISYRSQQEQADFTLSDNGGTLKTFRQLMGSGTIQKMLHEDRNKPLVDRRVILGYKDERLVYITMKSLYSCGIGGSSSTGKSTTVRFLLFQFILLGFKLVMIDPHISDEEESLAAQFANFQDVHAMAPCGGNDERVLSRAKAMHTELLRRMELGEKNGFPLLLVIDEFNGLMRRASDEVKDRLSALLLDIEQEGRKFGVYAWIIGQRWTENDLGGKGGAGVAIRTSLVSKIAHRFSDEAQAAVFMGTNAASVKQQNARLPRGEYIFLDADGGRYQITTPLTLSGDGDLVSALHSDRVAPPPTPPARTQAGKREEMSVSFNDLPSPTLSLDTILNLYQAGQLNAEQMVTLINTLPVVTTEMRAEESMTMSGTRRRCDTDDFPLLPDQEDGYQHGVEKEPPKEREASYTAPPQLSRSPWKYESYYAVTAEAYRLGYSGKRKLAAFIASHGMHFGVGTVSEGKALLIIQEMQKREMLKDDSEEKEGTE